MEIRQVAVALLEIEAVADEELVGDGEADVAHRQVVDQAPVGAVEQGRAAERAWPAQVEDAAQVVERQAGVDHVLDDEQVAPPDLDVQVLQQPDAGVAACRRVRAVAGQLDEVDSVEDGERPREVGEEDDTGLQRADEERLAALVVGCDLGCKLDDARADIRSAQVDLADALVDA